MFSKNKEEGRSLSWQELFELGKESIQQFLLGDSFMHGAALAYYAVFALIPIIYLAISFFGLIVGQDRIIEIAGELIKNNMGIVDISTLTELMYKAGLGGGSTTFYRAIGIIAVIFTSTAMFNSLSKSINVFYGIKITKKHRAFLNQLLKRLISFGVMAALASTVIILYFAQSLLIAFSTELLSYIGIEKGFVSSLIEHLSIIFINFIGFMMIFKYVHDARVSWKLAMTGAFFTAILLYFGQLLINYYLINYFYANNIGIAGTILIILSWIFYTSQIIFIGATYTSFYAKKSGNPILPK
ncbi:MAG: YihY/virulence factor BrkB family protein [Brumimicrobium sp.]|nr:YihY/virulence factor BrkB family protein [Brumimicrobium sp.]MCO5268807.1 YihY/virulence factor BrkB family protein [Brumimicrobium sp.]